MHTWRNLPHPRRSSSSHQSRWFPPNSKERATLKASEGWELQARWLVRAAGSEFSLVANESSNSSSSWKLLCAGVPEHGREHWEQGSKRSRAAAPGTGTCWLLCWVCMGTFTRAAGGTGTGTTAPGVPCPGQKSLWMAQETTFTDLHDFPSLLQLHPAVLQTILKHRGLGLGSPGGVGAAPALPQSIWSTRPTLG